MQGIAQIFEFERLLGLSLIVGLLFGCAQSVPVGSNAVSDAVDTVKTPSTSATPPQASGLTLEGSPATSVVAGSAYSFQPVSSQSGPSVLFTIVSQPKWASFDPDSGALTGTPGVGDVGTTTGIMILVSDATSTASVGPFVITVTASSAGIPTPTPTGSATLTWVAPTLNVDGSLLTNLAGFHVHYGTNAAKLDQTVTVPGAGTNMYVVNGLSTATYYFAVTAYAANGVESAESNVADKTL